MVIVSDATGELFQPSFTAIALTVVIIGRPVRLPEYWLLEVVGVLPSVV
jgi:hypothetical protein